MQLERAATRDTQMSSMQAYLAAKYMTGPKADLILARTTAATTKKKKRKPKVGEGSGTTETVLIKDAEEDLGWGKALEENEDEAMAVDIKDRSFKKRKVEPPAADTTAEDSGWITIRGDDESKAESEDVPMEETPTVPSGGLVMPSDFASTLPQSKSKRKGKERAIDGGQEETVYRDAQGRRIEVESEEQIAERKALEEREEKRKQAERKEWSKGLKQREDVAALKREEEKLRTRSIARRADDTDLNDMQKAQGRWNDPAAAFLTKSRSKGPKKPMYKGPIPPPNRFGIPPGYRWDGVDRSNGFEKKYFQTQNERGRTKLEAYQWSVDDM